jgi:predicted transcriptional regulator
MTVPRPPGPGLTKAQERRLLAAQEQAASAGRQLTEVIEALIEEGVRVEAIAKALGITRSAVYVRLKRHQG